MIQLVVVLLIIAQKVASVDFESPSKEENSFRDKLDSLKHVKLQRHIHIHYIMMKRSRRQLTFTRNNFQYAIYYTPELHKMIPTDSNSTDYSTYLKDVSIDFTQQQNQVTLPDDYHQTQITQYTINSANKYAINSDNQYDIQNHTHYLIQELFIFSAQRHDTLYNLNDFSKQTDEQITLDESKLIEYFRNKNIIEGKTNSVFVIVSSEEEEKEEEQQQIDFNFKYYISKETKQSFLYGFMNESQFYQNVKQANEYISAAYFSSIEQSLLQEERLYCLQEYIHSIEKIEETIIQDIEAGQQLLLPHTKLSDIFQLDEFFQFQAIWKEITIKYEMFFYLLNMNRFKTASKVLLETSAFFDDQLLPFLTETLTKEDVLQDHNQIILLLQQYTFSLLLLLFLLVFIYIYIKQSKVLDLFDKKFV